MVIANKQRGRKSNRNRIQTTNDPQICAKCAVMRDEIITPFPTLPHLSDHFVFCWLFVFPGARFCCCCARCCFLLCCCCCMLLVCQYKQIVSFRLIASLRLGFLLPRAAFVAPLLASPVFTGLHGTPDTQETWTFEKNRPWVDRKRADTFEIRPQRPSLFETWAKTTNSSRNAEM